MPCDVSVRFLCWFSLWVRRVGSTTTDKTVDRLGVAASLKLSFEGSIKISGEASVDYKNRELMGKLQSNFDFHAKGGDPAVAGMLAQAQASRGGGVHEAFALWLASVKVVPSVYGLKLDPIYNLFLSLPPSSDVDARILGLKQGVDVYLRETVDPTSTIALVHPNQALFSNFWRLRDTCLTFQAVIGAGNTFSTHLTTSVSRLDVGSRLFLTFFRNPLHLAMHVSDFHDSRSTMSSADRPCHEHVLISRGVLHTRLITTFTPRASHD